MEVITRFAGSGSDFIFGFWFQKQCREGYRYRYTSFFNLFATREPQTDGLGERFNQTLKEMLQKTATEDGKDCDKLIPYTFYGKDIRGSNRSRPGKGVTRAIRICIMLVMRE